MRKVKFKLWNNEIKRHEDATGLFHQWGQEADGEGQSNPIAIIEMDDGEVKTPYAGHVVFIEKMEPAKAQVVVEELRKEIEKLTLYKHCMSYNDSYFGEPAGLVKQVSYQLERLLYAAPLVSEPDDFALDALNKAQEKIRDLKSSPQVAQEPGTQTMQVVETPAGLFAVPDKKEPAQVMALADCHDSCGYIGAECDYPVCKLSAASPVVTQPSEQAGAVGALPDSISAFPDLNTWGNELHQLVDKAKSDLSHHSELDAEHKKHSMRVGEAVSYWKSKWPESLTSGVMYFNGERILREEFIDRARAAEEKKA